MTTQYLPVREVRLGSLQGERRAVVVYPPSEVLIFFVRGCVGWGVFCGFEGACWGWLWRRLWVGGSWGSGLMPFCFPARWGVGGELLWRSWWVVGVGVLGGWVAGCVGAGLGWCSVVVWVWWSLTFAAPGPDGARPPALARGGMSKSKRNPLLVPTGNHSIMAGRKHAAHPKKVDKKRSKYRGAFRRGELE